MRHSFEGLHICGDFGQIKQWFLDNQVPTPDGHLPLTELAFHNVHFGPLDGSAPKSWDGHLTVRSWLDWIETSDLFTGSKVEITHVVKTRWVGNVYQHRFRFVMLGEDWLSMLMMQELLRDGPDYPVLL